MGSAGEDPFGPIDGSVGSLVWVRRRNGSWWPGRILGLDELPEGCLPTPRPGTPVKLLGREDASVDWYNLEKSKRVKPFRCGEYDDCIEKAKASAFHLSKKAVKYARREDAILHALELENALLGIPDISTGQDTRDNDEQLVESPSSEQIEEENINGGLAHSEDDSVSPPELSPGSIVSFEELKCVKRRKTPNDSEDGGPKGVKKRMRGLEDLGMGGASSLRRKRSLNSHIREFMKKKSRRRTLSKVLECTPMVSVSVASGFEANESNKNNINSDSTTGRVSLNLSRNGDDDGVGTKAKENDISSVVRVGDDRSCELFDVPLVAEENHQSAAGVSKTVSGPSYKAQVVSGAHSSQSSHVESISLGKEEHNEIGSTGLGPAYVHNNITQIIEKNTSKWQLKGKRNSRPRKIDMDDEPETHLTGSNRVHGSLIPVVNKKETQVEIFRGWSWNVPSQRENNAGGSKSDVVAPQRLLSYRHSRFTVNPKYESSNFSLSHHASNGGPALFDAKMEVQMSYQPQHVPYISLMSKLNGKPVMGHPLPIKVLDDGFCDNLLSLGPECYRSISELEYNSLNGLSERKPCRLRASKRRSKSKSRKHGSKNGLKNGLLSKKVRKLSSLTGPHKKRQHKKSPVLENLKSPSIACVPIKVIFSRINAALSSSIRPPPRLTTTRGS